MFVGIVLGMMLVTGLGLIAMAVISEWVARHPRNRR